MNVCSIGSTCCCNSNKSAVLLQIISANKNVKNRESIMEGVVKKSTQKQLDKKMPNRSRMLFGNKLQI